MNILILGATGYLGSNMVHKFVEEGHHVFCVTRVGSETKCIEGLEYVTFLSNDLDAIEVLFKHNSIDWVINCACTYKANETLYGDMITSNLIFPLQVLNLAVRYGIKNHATIGTSLPENTNMYSMTKHKYAEIGRFMCDSEGINFGDIKLEMFYGGMFEPTNRFISSCKKSFLLNEPIALTVGTQKRDIIRMEDVVSIVARIVSSNIVQGFMTLPIGSGEQHSIIEIMEFMKTTMNSSSELKFGAVPARRNEPDTIADISWYRTIDYKLQFGYFDGLREECLSHM